MNNARVRVPGSLLHAENLTESAKLLWMLLRLGSRSEQAPMSPGFLAVRPGLCRRTVQRALAQLESAGWLRANDTASGDWASVPCDLLLDSRVGVHPTLLYATLQLIPAFQGRTGQFTYAELSALTGVSQATMKEAVRALLDTGWLQAAQRNKFSPIHFTLHNPVAEQREGEVAAASRRLVKAPFLGEALMREYLSLLVDSDEYEDNASPGFLVNPLTGEEMQYDRYYPPKVAFEFNGPQHYGPTARYADEADSRMQQCRDYIKLGMSSTRGISLVVLHPADLTLEIMRQRVDGLLPLRQLDGHEPLVAHLESVSRAYRRKAGKAREDRADLR